MRQITLTLDTELAELLDQVRALHPQVFNQGIGSAIPKPEDEITIARKALRLGLRRCRSFLHKAGEIPGRPSQTMAPPKLGSLRKRI